MPNEVTQKVWGWSEAQVVSPLCEVHRIDIRPGGYCSVHQHDRKHNIFTLVKGKLHVYVWDLPNADTDDRETASVRVLENPGDSINIAPGVVHQFYAPEYCMAMEVYYPASVRSEDIFRFNILGGIDDQLP